jgi:hypothetical protein
MAIGTPSVSLPRLFAKSLLRIGNSGFGYGLGVTRNALVYTEYAYLYKFNPYDPPSFTKYCSSPTNMEVYHIGSNMYSNGVNGQLSTNQFYNWWPNQTFSLNITNKNSYIS